MINKRGIKLLILGLFLVVMSCFALGYDTLYPLIFDRYSADRDLLVFKEDITLYSAELYLYNLTGLTVAIPNSAVYYNISGLSSNHLNGFTFDGTRLTAIKPGRYLFDFGASYGGGNNQKYGIGIAKNGNIETSRNCYTLRTTTSLAAANVNDACTLLMAKNDYVILQIDDEAGVTANADFYVISLTATRIGDT